MPDPRTPAQPDPFADLPELPTEDFAAFFDEPVEVRNAGVGLAEDRKLSLRAHARRLLNLQHVANAAAALEQLPDPGETYHIVCKGNWPAWALVPAMLRLTGGATIQTLHLATLGFSRDNGEELMALLDGGAIRQMAMVVSCYFRTNETDLVDWIAFELKRRSQAFASVRTHAKIIAARFTDGRAIAVESSANLRSCRNVEQFTITHSEELAAFHADWIDTIIANGDHK